jgi:hypothetical protein
MRSNDETLGNFFFRHFFEKAATTLRARAQMMSMAFPCCNVHLLHL